MNDTEIFSNPLHKATLSGILKSKCNRRIKVYKERFRNEDQWRAE